MVLNHEIYFLMGCKSGVFFFTRQMLGSTFLWGLLNVLSGLFAALYRAPSYLSFSEGWGTVKDDIFKGSLDSLSLSLVTQERASYSGGGRKKPHPRGKESKLSHLKAPLDELSGKDELKRARQFGWPKFREELILVFDLAERGQVSVIGGGGGSLQTRFSAWSGQLGTSGHVPRCVEAPKRDPKNGVIIIRKFFETAKKKLFTKSKKKKLKNSRKRIKKTNKKIVKIYLCEKKKKFKNQKN